MLGSITYEEYAGNPADGDGRHVAVSVGGVRVAGAVHLRRRHDRVNPDAMAWTVVPVLRLPGVGELRTFEARDEQDARAWLAFLAGLYATTVAYEGVCVDDVEPPADVITEADIAGKELTVAELDEAERAYRDEVLDCCSGTDYGCSHYRSYPSIVTADRW